MAIPVVKDTWSRWFLIGYLNGRFQEKGKQKRQPFLTAFKLYNDFSNYFTESMYSISSTTLVE